MVQKVRFITLCVCVCVCVYVHVCVCIKPLQVAFAAADSVTGLKLVETGLPKEKIALVALVMVPLQIVLPWIIR